MLATAAVVGDTAVVVSAVAVDDAVNTIAERKEDCRCSMSNAAAKQCC